jgi:predicted glycoside hydrolase/deacetylase ChbG (UPF0249 family)
MPSPIAASASSSQLSTAPEPQSGGQHPLLVCADDYGMSAAVSQAILHLSSQARLSATSAMVLSPLWPEHAAWLQDQRGRLDVGLHLDWTSAFALAAGHGLPLGRLMLASSARQLDASRVRSAIERQLDLFEDIWQAPPDHVDGHQHVHQFPVVREQLVQALLARYPQASPRPWLRISRPLRPGLDLKARVIGLMGAAALNRLALEAGLPHSNWLTGIYDFSPEGSPFLSRMTEWLDQSRTAQAVVLMCHPGMATSDADDPIASARAREFDMLSSPAWPRLLQTHALQLVRGPRVFSPNSEQR